MNTLMIEIPWVGGVEYNFSEAQSIVGETGGNDLGEVCKVGEGVRNWQPQINLFSKVQMPLYELGLLLVARYTDIEKIRALLLISFLTSKITTSEILLNSV